MSLILRQLGCRISSLLLALFIIAGASVSASASSPPEDVTNLQVIHHSDSYRELRWDLPSTPVDSIQVTFLEDYRVVKEVSLPGNDDDYNDYSFIRDNRNYMYVIRTEKDGVYSSGVYYFFDTFN